jgi:predicted Zn-dependent protease
MNVVEPLKPPDSFAYAAAEGWFELGCAVDAEAELEQLSPESQGHPAVLDLRWQLCAEKGDWDRGVEMAARLREALPQNPGGWLHHAYALRRASGGGLEAAWADLHPALEKFPDNSMVSYNLACYACQLNQLDKARDLLRRAMSGPEREKFKTMALRDSDLEALRKEIENL